MPTADNDNGDDDLVEKVTEVAIKEGIKLGAELIKSRISGLDDDDSMPEENPTRQPTVRAVGIIKTDEGSEDEAVEANPTSEEFSVPFGLDRIGVEELREIIRQFPPHLLRERKISGYNVYLGRCLQGTKLDDDTTASEHVSKCNLSWSELPEAEREIFRELAFEKNRIFIPTDAIERDMTKKNEEDD